MLTEKKRKQLLSYWEDPQFAGSFSGSSTFMDALKKRGIKVSEKDVVLFLNSIPSYVNRVHRLKITKYRPYTVQGVNLLWEADVGIMDTRSSTFKAFVLCVDVYSRRIFTSAIEGYTLPQLQAALEDIFKQNSGTTPQTLAADEQFTPLQKWLATQNVHFNIKSRRHKAAMAENSVWLLKRRLAHYTSHTFKPWEPYLKQATQNINDTPRKFLGGLRPSQVLSSLDDPVVRQFSKMPEQVPWFQQMENQNKYESDKSQLQVGDLVLYDYKRLKSDFEKSYHEKVRCIPIFQGA